MPPNLWPVFRMLTVRLWGLTCLCACSRRETPAAHSAGSTSRMPGELNPQTVAAAASPSRNKSTVWRLHPRGAFVAVCEGSLATKGRAGICLDLPDWPKPWREAYPPPNKRTPPFIIASKCPCPYANRISEAFRIDFVHKSMLLRPSTKPSFFSVGGGLTKHRFL